MIKLLKVSAVILGTSLAVGCPPTPHPEKLQADDARVQSQIVSISAKADRAASDASAAAAAANRAADSAAETNQKLDRMLNKAMMK